MTKPLRLEPGPPHAPLAMPPQDLSRAPQAAPLPADPPAVLAARVFVFGTALALTGALAFVVGDWFNEGGLAPVELGIIACGALAAFGIALSVATSALGLLPRTARAPAPGRGMDIAILLPLYGEEVGPIARMASRLLAELRASGQPHGYSLHILSDTRDRDAAERERRAFAMVASMHPDLGVYYRRRIENRRFKAGNIEDWVTRHGGAYEAMLVLDADSVMTARAVGRMADTMAAEPRLGLVQSVPRLVGARSIFARAQAFANTVYGTTLSRGLAMWAGTAANYWGHNAMIRTRAFAEAAGLPDLPGRRPFGGVILSHDFVEGALLRRAGWQVRFMPEATGSYEGTPGSPIAYVLRDRRWCQGNLQHLRLIFAAGLHPLSRVHMAQGAMAYLASAIWAVLVVLWVLVGDGQGDGPIRYFSPANPLFPAWPEMDLVSRVLILGLIYGFLVVPKLLGALAFWVMDPWLRSAGGPARFAGSIGAEIVLSVLMAPMMMVQHVLAVIRALAGRDTGWAPAEREAPGFVTCLRFHRTELVLGAGMLAMAATGSLSLLLLPVAIPLLLAPVLSWALSAEPAWAQALFCTPQDAKQPAREADGLSVGDVA